MPNLTSPVILNAAINATLSQPPQSWWASTTMSALITASVTLLAVYLGQRWTKGSERKRDFLKARRQAYYKYITVFSDAMRINEWSPSLISEKLPILYKAALEAGEYGDNNDITCSWRSTAIINPERSFEISHLQSHFTPASLRSSKCKMEYGSLDIKSFYGFIELLEFLMELDPDAIKMNSLAQTGNYYIPIFRNLLLSEWERPWLTWIKKSRRKIAMIKLNLLLKWYIWRDK